MNIEIFVTNFEDFGSRPKVSNPIDEKKILPLMLLEVTQVINFSMLRDLA